MYPHIHTKNTKKGPFPAKRSTALSGGVCLCSAEPRGRGAQPGQRSTAHGRAFVQESSAQQKMVKQKTRRKTSGQLCF